MSGAFELKDNVFVLTDIETTGFSPTKDRIIEVAMVRYLNGEVVDSYETLINPQRYVSPAIQNVTGITPDELKYAPIFSDVAEDIYQFVGDDVLVAHNIGFDYSFLKNSFSSIGISFHPERLCTVQLSRKLFPDLSRYSLDHIINSFGFRCDDRHRAMGDVQVMVQLFDHIFDHFSSAELGSILGKTLHKTHVPSRLKKQVNSIPNTSGVYSFYDEKGTLLYVGKSIHLRDRVKSHFGDTKNRHYMSFSKLITDIEVEVTAGDIEAQLTEATYIKDKMPIHNQQLRRVKQMVYAIEDTDENGYLIPQLRTNLPVQDEVGSVIGMYRSRQRAREHFQNVVKDHNLCDRYMGLQKTSNACFGYHLNRCRGACIQDESPEDYNLRFRQAFEKSRLRAWPYKGPVAIRERNSDFEKEIVHVVDRWCYLGSAESIDEVSDALEAPRLFDHDMYTILVKALTDSSVEKIEISKQETENRKQRSGNREHVTVNG